MSIFLRRVFVFILVIVFVASLILTIAAFFSGGPWIAFICISLCAIFLFGIFSSRIAPTDAKTSLYQITLADEQTADKDAAIEYSGGNHHKSDGFVRSDGIVTVRSFTSNRYYTVDLIEQLCSCPDFQYRRAGRYIEDPQRLCKHLRAALGRSDLSIDFNPRIGVNAHDLSHTHHRSVATPTTAASINEIDIRNSNNNKMAALHAWCAKIGRSEKAITEIAFAEFAQIVDVPHKARLSKEDMKHIQAVAKINGLYVLPDPAIELHSPEILYPLFLVKDDGTRPRRYSSRTYRKLTLAMRMAGGLVRSGGIIDEQKMSFVKDHLEKQRIDQYQKIRLIAAAQYFATIDFNMRGVKAILMGLPEKDRDKLSDFLIRLAHSDGKLDIAEKSVLKRIFGAMGQRARLPVGKAPAAVENKNCEGGRGTRGNGLSPPRGKNLPISENRT